MSRPEGPLLQEVYSRLGLLTSSPPGPGRQRRGGRDRIDQARERGLEARPWRGRAARTQVV